MAAGMFYWMVPRLYGTKLYSRRAADLHFYIGTVGILLYIISMWVSGITQGMMWRAVDAQGHLVYPNFVETLEAIKPMYWTRLVGGILYLVGMIVMAWNLWKTAKSGEAVDGQAEVIVEVKPAKEPDWKSIIFASPVILAVLAITFLLMAGYAEPIGSIAFIVLVLAVGFFGIFFTTLTTRADKPTWHSIIEGRAFLFTVLTVLAVLVGGVAEIVPSIILQQTDAEMAKKTNPPYRALELEGRDVYVAEGCYTCHSQMIRPFRFETARYGDVSKLDDSRWDHPFQWGSKRTGPDLARMGGKYSNVWHWQHLLDPRSVSGGSNMPSYAHLEHARIDFQETTTKLRAMRNIGVPYTSDDIAAAPKDAAAQASEIVLDLETQGVAADPTSKIVALTAYLQRIGHPPAPVTPPVAAPVTITDPPPAGH
jgi:cytochrome c oxidase cbb3-type subunit I/II